MNRSNPGELDNWLDDLNPESKVVIPCAYGVPSLEFAEAGDKFLFERLGYFVVDKDSTPEKLIFNRTVALRDTFRFQGESAAGKCQEVLYRTRLEGCIQQ
ncbi:glutamine--tRNA ligase-like protein [Tanacetum coccineum]